MTEPVPTDQMMGKVVLERYRITGRIGEGGMGAVYEAEHINLPKTYAIKVMHAVSGMSPDHQKILDQRFDQEAKLCASVNHPGLVEVTDFGASEGVMYIVMEFVKGEDVFHLLSRQGGLEPGRALAIIRDLARAVGALHEKGIIHRDLKPHNVMIEAGTDRVVLMDLGIAKDMHSGAGVTQNALGTPAYMAPEQMQNAAKCTYASDVYGLGATLYEMLTGNLPFEGETAIEVLTNIVAVTNEYRTLTEYARAKGVQFPPAVAGLLADMTEFKPAMRIQTTAQVVERIETALAQLERPGAAATLPSGTDIVSARAGLATTPVTHQAPLRIETGHGDSASYDMGATLPTPPPPEDRQDVLAALAGPRPARSAAAKPGGSLTTVAVVGSLAVIGAVGVLLLMLLGGDATVSGGTNGGGKTPGVKNGGAPAVVPKGEKPPNGGNGSGPVEAVDGIDYPAALGLPVGGAGPLKLVLVKAGTFTLGSDTSGDDDQKPARRITFTRPFYIGQYEVTTGQFAAYLNAAGSKEPVSAEKMNLTRDGDAWRPREGFARRPIAYVKHGQARAFCAWLTEKTGVFADLPGEVEWEYAARGADARLYPWGNEWDPSRAHATGQSASAGVGSYPLGRSWCGAHDMAGNVWEWCADKYVAKRYGRLPATDPPVLGAGASDSLRTIRGGGYGSDDTVLYQSTYRNGAGGRDSVLGFRVRVRATPEVLKLTTQ